MTSPEDLLEMLCEGVATRKEKSLRMIHEVCEEQRRRGSMDLSVATIGRLSAEKGGPAAGAIRNTTGEAYRALIKAHLDAAGGKKPKGKPHQADENPFEGITDPVLRARIGVLLAENESLRGQLQAARNLANTQSVVELRFNEPPNQIKFELSSQEREALRHALSAENLDAMGWEINEKGRVVSEDGSIVFKPGMASGLKKILDLY